MQNGQNEEQVNRQSDQGQAENEKANYTSGQSENTADEQEVKATADLEDQERSNDPDDLSGDLAGNASGNEDAEEEFNDD